MKETTVSTTGHQTTRSVTARQHEVLTILSHRPRVLVGELASTLGVSSAAVTKAVRRLERKGLVTRIPDSGDRRCVKVCLTEKGLEIVHTTPVLASQARR
jgi:DNA-binding MarR family transcriptional regulator